jgi:hypothetical protein
MKSTTCIVCKTELVSYICIYEMDLYLSKNIPIYCSRHYCECNKNDAQHTMTSNSLFQLRHIRGMFIDHLLKYKGYPDEMFLLQY